MKLKTKLIISFMCVSLIPVFVIWGISLKNMTDSIESGYEHRLIFLRENKKKQLSEFYEQISLQAQFIANNEKTKQSFKDLSHNYFNIPLIGVESKKETLKEYYRSKFKDTFEKNSGTQLSRNTDKYVDDLSPQATILQEDFIIKNKYPIG